MALLYTERQSIHFVHTDPNLLSIVQTGGQNVRLTHNGFSNTPLLTQRGYTNVPGLGTDGKSPRNFRIATDVMDGYAGAGLGHKFWDLYCVQEIMTAPAVIFEDLKREDQQASMCYAGIPSRRHMDENTTVPPLPGRTFAVYIESDGRIFEWRWEISDQVSPAWPVDWKTRYGPPLWNR